VWAGVILFVEYMLINTRGLKHRVFMHNVHSLFIFCVILRGCINNFIWEW